MVLAEGSGQQELALVDDCESRGAQAELLALVTEHLARCHPERFALRGSGTDTHLESLEEGLTWRLADFDASPLKLLGQLVQEDVCLMREETSDSSARHIFVAGVVMDSFNPVEKHMLPMMDLHGPVPGYAVDLHESMGRVFQTLRKPVWRANFAIMEWRGEGEEELSLTDNELLQRLYLKVEYETLRRLPKNSDYLVFTIRPHTAPLSSLAATPLACAALASEIRALSRGLLEYRGLGQAATQRVVLGFLDAVTAHFGVSDAAPATVADPSAASAESG